VGTAIIDSPLQAQPVRGPVYIALNSASPLPGLIVILPPPVGVRLDGEVDISPLGVRNTFPLNPDLPVRSFTLQFDGGRPDSLIIVNRDLCAADADRDIKVHLVAHNGKESTFSQELATPGCDPTAKVSIRRKGRRATLVARMRAARVGPGITRFALKLPKTLARGKARPTVFADGARLKPASHKHSATLRFPHEVRTATLAWRGLKVGRRLRKTATIRLSMTDGRPHVTSVKQKVRVRGKAPRKKRR
jgi:hypothetical protein